MKYRVLGKTGLKVSVIGVGTWQYGGEWGKDFSSKEVAAIISRAGELGINLVDTAECYGDHLAEKLVGQAIRGRRDDWIVATKFGHKFNAYQKREQRWDAASVQKQLDDSLVALGTDYIDIYQFHSGKNEVFDNDQLWSMLANQKKAGKIRFLGISLSGGIEDTYQADQATERGADVFQVLYNRVDRRAEAAILPSALRQKLGVLARVPLASGFLSGKYNAKSVFPENDVRSGWEPQRRLAILNQVEEIRKNELPAGLDMAQWAIAWCLGHEAVAATMPGFKNVKQLESGAGAADLEMVNTDHPLSVA